MTNSLPKKEKLKSRKLINELFAGGHSVKVFPLLAVYKESDALVSGSQFAFTVSKRNFKKAVDRNKVKRLIREAYRQKKDASLENSSPNRIVMFIFLGKRHSSQETINNSMEKFFAEFYQLNTEQS